MFASTWRFATVMLAAMTAGMGLCHVLEMPARLRWDAQLWVDATVVGGLYRAFGSVGAVIVVATVVGCFVLALLMRGRGAAVFRLTLLAAVLFLAALIGWWLIVFPANQEFAGWELAQIPADWADWRARWEWGHAANATLQFVALGALVLSLVLEAPGGARS